MIGVPPESLCARCGHKELYHDESAPGGLPVGCLGYGLDAAEKPTCLCLGFKPGNIGFYPTGVAAAPPEIERPAPCPACYTGCFDPKTRRTTDPELPCRCGRAVNPGQTARVPRVGRSLSPLTSLEELDRELREYELKYAAPRPIVVPAPRGYVGAGT